MSTLESDRSFDNDQLFEVEPDTAKSGVISTRLWLLLLGVGLLLLELTADPVFVVIAACSKFGVDDLLTAFWLRRKDPVKKRGRTHFWFYLAYGLWKVTVVALGMSFLVIIVASINGDLQLKNNVPKEYIASISLCACTLFLSSFATWIAVAKAWWGGVKVWVNSSVHRSRRDGIWPPQPRGENRVNRLVLTAFVPVIIVAIFVTALLALSGMNPKGKNDAIFGVVLLFGFVIGLPIALLIFQDRVLHAIKVNHPANCWTVPRHPLPGVVLADDGFEGYDDEHGRI